MVVCAFYVCVCVLSVLCFSSLTLSKKEIQAKSTQGGGCVLVQVACATGWHLLFVANKLWSCQPCKQRVEGTETWFCPFVFLGVGNLPWKKNNSPWWFKDSTCFLVGIFGALEKKNSSLVGWFSSWPFLGWWVQHDLQWSGILKGHGLKITWRGFFKTSQQRRAAKT